ncbi:MAG: hypothetical protein QOE14_2054 [Humisphaera sp.]|nr:hypothetical protein [Humisphaera sp.]
MVGFGRFRSVFSRLRMTMAIENSGPANSWAAANAGRTREYFFFCASRAGAALQKPPNSPTMRDFPPGTPVGAIILMR